MLSFLKWFGKLEFSLIQVIIYFGLWLLNDYLATLITLIVAPILLGVLTVSLISEWLEKSKVPRDYFIMMAISFLIPIVVALLYSLLFGGNFGWVKK